MKRLVALALVALLVGRSTEAAITFVGSNANSTSPNVAVTVDIEPIISVDPGDLILVAFAVGDSPGVDTDISLSGFTEVTNCDIADTSDTNDTELWVGYKIGTGSEATTGAFTAIGGTNAANAAVVMVFRGVDQASPFSVAAVPANGGNTSNADPGQIATVATNWVVIAGATGASGGTGPSLTAPANYTTNSVTRGHDDTVDVAVAMSYRSAGFANPENPGAYTGVNIGTAANNSWAACTMALKEAVAPTCAQSLALLGVGCR